MWGTRFPSYATRSGERFIPTYVGNTEEQCAEFLQKPVHPHVCGEHGRAVPILAISPGSSPRMWGTLSVQLEAGCVERFIPTYVGNTGSEPSPGFHVAVHPHVCGEH